jgi:hypothetical protein
VGALGIILRFATTVYDRPATIRYLTRSPVDKRKFNTDAEDAMVDRGEGRFCGCCVKRRRSGRHRIVIPKYDRCEA